MTAAGTLVQSKNARSTRYLHGPQGVQGA